jgi:elongation factor Ts
MAEISAKDVAALRKVTGAGMMDCKKALAENDGDMEAAKTWLRERNLAGAAKRAGREADQGAIDVVNTGSVAALVELNCETDFVAKGEPFKAMVAKLAAHVAATGDHDVAATAFEGSTVEAAITEFSGTLGEKMGLGRVVRYETTDGVLDAYKHIQDTRGVIGVLVELAGVDAASASAQEVAHDIALHIASAAPRYVSRVDVPEADVDTERKVLEAQTREEGKPENAIAKIVDGKLNGYFKSVCLVDQPFVKDNKVTVGQLVQSLGAGASVRRFARVKIGED